MKLDFTKIEGYEEMTPEEKIKALEGFDFNLISKEQFDKTSGELAKLKKEYNSRLSEEEQNKIARDEEFTKMQEELEALRRDKIIADYTNSYLSLGYDEKLAKETAVYLADGNFEKVFEAQQKHEGGLEKKLKADLMKKNPEPQGGEGKVTKDDLKKMSFEERYKFSQDHPEEYKALYGKE